MSTDLTFITNEENASLLSRFNVLVKECKAFDVLVGYFFASGFHALYKSLENTESIRILVGINTNRSVLDAITYASALWADVNVFSPTMRSRRASNPWW